MITIGIDLDNTIINYDLAFSHESARLGFTSKDLSMNKAKIKKHVLTLSNGQKKWEILQGKVYSSGLKKACLNHGFLRFVHRLSAREIKCTIVSHKTRHAHHCLKKIDIRQLALNFLKEKLILNSKKELITDIYFTDTLEAKVLLIKKLKFNYFIDDLLKVFKHKDFPTCTEKILYSSEKNNQLNINRFCSFDKIASFIIGNWKIQDLSSIPVTFKKISNIVGKGNSKVFKLTGTDDKLYFMKVYPFDINHNRIFSEFNGLTEISNITKSVVKPVFLEKNLNLAIYEWINGDKVINPSSSDVDQAISFLNIINNNKDNKMFKIFPKASAACFCRKDIELQIHNRVLSLYQANNTLINEFINLKVKRSLEKLVDRAMFYEKKFKFSKILPKSKHILSPSDFGFHNVLKKKNGELIFFDFEYFGWDDPIKLISDFYFHPAMNLSDKLKSYWVEESCRIFSIQKRERLIAYMPLFGICWVLIRLNNFIDAFWNKRVDANSKLINHRKEILDKDLLNASQFLDRINHKFLD